MGEKVASSAPCNQRQKCQNCSQGLRSMASMEPELVSVSRLLAAASEALPIGKMVQTSTLSLFEAMSAVEIGNPKMDAGCCSKPVTSASEAAAAELSTSEVEAVMDRLLSQEASHFFYGNPAAASVYSCVYLMAPDRSAALLIDGFMGSRS